MSSHLFIVIKNHTFIINFIDKEYTQFCVYVEVEIFCLVLKAVLKKMIFFCFYITVIKIMNNFIYELGFLSCC